MRATTQPELLEAIILREPAIRAEDAASDAAMASVEASYQQLRASIARAMENANNWYAFAQEQHHVAKEKTNRQLNEVADAMLALIALAPPVDRTEADSLTSQAGQVARRIRQLREELSQLEPQFAKLKAEAGAAHRKANSKEGN